MKTYKTLIAIMCLVILTGCQAMMYGTVDNFAIRQIKPGMTKTEVIALIGEPNSIGLDSDKGEEILVYKRMRNAFSFFLHNYAVVLRNGKVVRYGEQINVSYRRLNALA
jgi:hypothetical protein